MSPKEPTLEQERTQDARTLDRATTEVVRVLARLRERREADPGGYRARAKIRRAADLLTQAGLLLREP